MEDEEHEVYGQEIPVDAEDVEMGAGGDDAAKVRDAPAAAAAAAASSASSPLSRTPNPNDGADPLRVQLHELDEMKRRLKEMEEEAAALREMQAKVAKEMQGGDPNATTSEAKEEMDSRSVFVGNIVS
ncbi:Polyadenylate-binding protein 2 [Hordeum vulgare]|nr:Polyadenylate-binding protein 2 [Hordeum vulgare]